MAQRLIVTPSLAEMVMVPICIWIFARLHKYVIACAYLRVYVYTWGLH